MNKRQKKKALTKKSTNKQQLRYYKDRYSAMCNEVDRLEFRVFVLKEENRRLKGNEAHLLKEINTLKTPWYKRLGRDSK